MRASWPLAGDGGDAAERVDRTAAGGIGVWTGRDGPPRQVGPRGISNPAVVHAIANSNRRVPLKKWAIKRIDRLRRSFLWRGRSLRLRWLWFAWTERERPWVGSPPPCDEVDKQLFRASTVVNLGDGRKASFWNCSWLNGRAPRDIAPDLFKLAWRKNRSVKDDITNHQWTRGLWRMNSVEQMT